MTAPGRYFAISDAERSLICLRLVIEALAEHEKYSDSETDWESLYHMAEISTGLVQALDQMRQDAWQETDGAQAEAKRLQQQLDAQQQDAIEAGELMKAEIEVLRQQLDESQARRVVIADEAANDKLQKIAIHCELQAAQGEITSLRQQIDAQQQDVDAMRAQIERLQKLADTVRSASSYFRGSTKWHEIEAALDELDAQAAPVAETAEGGT